MTFNWHLSVYFRGNYYLNKTYYLCMSKVKKLTEGEEGEGGGGGGGGEKFSIIIQLSF